MSTDVCLNYSFLILCGYKGTGKSTFYDDLLYKKERWCIYSDKNIDHNDIYKTRSSILLSEPAIIKISPMLGLKLLPSHIHSIKDDFTVSTRTIRDHIYEHMAREMLKDRFIWEKELIKKIKSDTETLDYIIPDMFSGVTKDFFSSPSNTPSMNCTSIISRMFRKEVIPPIKEKTQHGIDTLLTDVLMVPIENHEEHFSEALKLFPQYSSFKLIYKPDTN